MSDSRYDAIVIGGGFGGLVASAYLARTGRRTLLLEAEGTFGGAARATSPLASDTTASAALGLYALDPRMVKDLGLTRRGLKFAVRDISTAALKLGAAPLLLGRDVHAATRAIAARSPRDAETYTRYHAAMFALARALRPWWWENSRSPLNLSNRRQQCAFEQLRATSAADMLNGQFESDELKAALAFDAPSIFEPGSALILVWRAAQEMCGLQGAIAAPLGGVARLTESLLASVEDAGTEIRTRARVTRLILAGNSVTGVELDTGEAVYAHAVLSSLSREQTLLDLAPCASAGFDETFALQRNRRCSADVDVRFILNAAPFIGGQDVSQTSRFILAERLETFASNQAAARERILPDDLVMEVTVPTAADPSLAPRGQHLIFARVCGLPLDPSGGWPAMSAMLSERVVAALEPHAAQLRERIIGVEVSPPWANCSSSVTRLLSSYADRIGTPIKGLFLCGGAAEPVGAVSGRAGRIAAGIANGWLAREKRA